MAWLSLISGFLKLSIILAGYLKDRKLIHAGKAEAIVEGLKDVSTFIDDAAKGSAGMRFDTEWSYRVREKYRRK